MVRRTAAQKDELRRKDKRTEPKHLGEEGGLDPRKEPDWEVDLDPEQEG